MNARRCALIAAAFVALPLFGCAVDVGPARPGAAEQTSTAAQPLAAGGSPVAQAVTPGGDDSSPSSETSRGAGLAVQGSDPHPSPWNAAGDPHPSPWHETAGGGTDQSSDPHPSPWTDRDPDGNPVAKDQSAK